MVNFMMSSRFTPLGMKPIISACRLLHSGCYTIAMDWPSHLREFAGRDWARVEENKRQHWASVDLSPDESLAVANRLRRHVQAIQPSWPSVAERREDLATHRRLASLLTRVSTH